MNKVENINAIVENINGSELEILTLGNATELTTGVWGMWPEYHGTEAR